MWVVFRRNGKDRDNGVGPALTEQRYAGVITFISPEAEFTPKNAQTPDERAKLVYRVKVTLKNPNGVFKPGLPADAFLEN